MSTIIAKLGGPTKIAHLLSIKPPSVFEWTRIPRDRCPDIEFATKGKARVESMRPDIRWVRVADEAWPHPKGRPLPDVATLNRPKKRKAAHVAR